MTDKIATDDAQIDDAPIGRTQADGAHAGGQRTAGDATRAGVIRRAELADVPELVRLKALLMVDGWPFDIELDDEWRARCTAVAQELIPQPHYASFVIDADGHEGAGSPLASCVTVSVEQHLPGPDGTGRSAYIGDMCTDAAYRGRGYGSLLLDRAMNWARQEGAGWASLFSTESGRSVYIKAGFSPEGPFEHLSVGLD